MTPSKFKSKVDENLTNRINHAGKNKELRFQLEQLKNNINLIFAKAEIKLSELKSKIKDLVMKTELHTSIKQGILNLLEKVKVENKNKPLVSIG